MMKPAAALSLKPDDQVKFGKETLTVIGSINVGTHEEPLLVSGSGRKYHGTLFIAHLLTRLGVPEEKPEEEEPAFSWSDDAAPEQMPEEQQLDDSEKDRLFSAQPAEAATAPAIEIASSELELTNEESNIPEDELELVKAYTLNELI
jgi:hypothetical protein